MKFKASIIGLGFLLIFSIPLVSQYAPFYVLDGYGGVHAGGGAPAISPATPYFGWDIAKSFDYVPVASSSSNYGDGILVLDGYGGIHKGGKLLGISVTATPYFGWDIARAIVYRVVDPQAYGYSIAETYLLLDNNMTTVASFYMNLPDDGYVFVMASAMLSNSSTTLSSAVRYGIGVDDNAAYDASTHRWASFNAGFDTNGFHSHQAASTAKVFYLSAGQHYFYFLVQRVAGTAIVNITNRTLSAIYINKNYHGWSQEAKEAGALIYSDQSNLGKK
jgi:hypothetical protein